eukprot:9979556-Karenia_brevis.AAC.1
MPGRKLVEACRDVHPDKNWHLSRTKGIVQAEDPKILWKYGVVTKKHVDKDAVVDTFNRKSGQRGSDEMWCL